MTYENQVIQNNLISLATQDGILNQSMCDKKISPSGDEFSDQTTRASFEIS